MRTRVACGAPPRRARRADEVGGSAAGVAGSLAGCVAGVGTTPPVAGVVGVGVVGADRGGAGVLGPAGVGGAGAFLPFAAGASDGGALAAVFGATGA